MKKIWIAIACVVVLGAVIGMTGCSDKPVVLGSEDLSNVEINVSGQQEGIWVSGTGEVTATPDIALISVGIEVQKETVAEAQAAAIEAMDKVVAALKDNGVKEEDIQTQQYSIRKISEWEKVIYDEGYEEEIILGYQVTNVVRAKIKDIDTVGTVIDSAAAAGGNYTRIDSISFTVDDPQPYYVEARAKAIEYAKAKAEQMAELGGVTLGSLTYISESSYYSPNYVRSDMAMEGGTPSSVTSISPGELEISATVQMVYSID